MVASAAGPITSIYLLLKRVPKLAFIGTTSWLFLLLNLVKMPHSVSLGLLTVTSLRIDLPLVPEQCLKSVDGVGKGVPSRVSSEGQVKRGSR